MEKKLYMIDFGYLDGRTELHYFKLTESEKNLLEWLYKEGILYYYSFEAQEEPFVIEF